MKSKDVVKSREVRFEEFDFHSILLCETVKYLNSLMSSIVFPSETTLDSRRNLLQDLFSRWIDSQLHNGITIFSSQIVVVHYVYDLLDSILLRRRKETKVKSSSSSSDLDTHTFNETPCKIKVTLTAPFLIKGSERLLKR